MAVFKGTLVPPALSSSPGSPAEGQIYQNVTDHKFYVYNGTAWVPLTKTFFTYHTWAIGGEIKVPSGDTDFIPPFFVLLATGQTAGIAQAKYKINSGTSATVKVTKNGSDATGFTGISVTSTAGTTNPTDVAVADGDVIALVVTAVSGTPKNLSFTLVLQHVI